MTSKVEQEMEEFFALAYDAQVLNCADPDALEVDQFPERFRKYLVMYVETDKSACGCFAEYLSDNGFLA